MTQWFILYCLLNNPNKVGHIISIVKEEYFPDTLSLEVYRYIIELVTKDIKLSIDLIVSKFDKDEKEIREKLNLAIDAEQYDEFIKNMRDNFVNNKIHSLGNAITNKQDIKEVDFLAYVNNFMDDISLNQDDNLQYADELSDEFFNVANLEEEVPNTIQYGIHDLDNFMNGITDEDYIVVAGRPSMGKSAIMGYAAMKNALRNKVTIFFSLEMSAQQLIKRMFSASCETELWKFKKRGNRSHDEQERFKTMVTRFKKMPLVIDTTSSIDINTMRSTIQKVKLKYGKVDLVVIDYLQLMSGKGDGQNQNQLLTDVSKGVKGLCKQFHIPIMAGSQLSRSCEMRDNKRPIMSDLRDSGSLEQDADIVMALYRDSYYNYNPDHIRLCEVLVRKYRNGEVGKIIIDYNSKTQAYKDVNPVSNLGKIAKRFMYE